jgi:pilus assembly protein FimV
MGREIDPTNPLYGGSGAVAAAPAAAPVVETKAAPANPGNPAVDFDLGFGAATTTMPNFAAQKTVVLEPEVSSLETTAIMSSADLHDTTQSTNPTTSQSTPMDFDITGTNPGFPAANFNTGSPDSTAVLNMDDLVFDVTATHPRVPVPSAPAPAAPAKDDGMAFTLDFPTETTAKFTAPPVPDLGLGEISLNLDNLKSSSGSGGAKDERWQEVATKLDLAKAYQEMGDVAGAREILDEVLRDGDEQQRESAQTLMQQLL